MPFALANSVPFNGHKACVYALTHCDGSGGFLSSGSDGLVVAWQVGAPDQGIVVAKVGDAVYSLHQDRTRRMLLIGTGGGRLLVIDRSTKTEVQAVDLHRKGIFRILSHTPDGFVCAGGDGILSSWRWMPASNGGPPTIELIRRIPLCEEKLRDLALSPNGDRLAVACGDGTVRELETGLFNETARMDGHGDGSTSVTYHPEKPVLLSGGKDGYLRLWRTDGGAECLHAMAVHKGPVYTVSIDPSGRWLATAGRDSLVKLWDAGSLEPLYRSTRDRTGHTHSVNAALWCGGTLITASDDRNIRSWDFVE